MPELLKKKLWEIVRCVSWFLVKSFIFPLENPLKLELTIEMPKESVIETEKHEEPIWLKVHLVIRRFWVVRLSTELVLRVRNMEFSMFINPQFSQ